MNRIKQFSQACIFLSFAFVISGCGESEDLGYVSGKVTVPNGESSTGLLVRFANGATGVGATAVVAEDGTYELKHNGNTGVPVGTYKIAVTAYVPQMSDKEQAEFYAASSQEQKQITEKRNAKAILVPEKYQNQRTSGLSYEIVTGIQKHDLLLTEQRAIAINSERDWVPSPQQIIAAFQVSPTTLGTESNRSASVSTGDLDGDGDLDTVVANGRHRPQQNFIFLNDGKSRFPVMRPLGVDPSTAFSEGTIFDFNVACS